MYEFLASDGVIDLIYAQEKKPVLRTYLHMHAAYVYPQTFNNSC